MKGPSCLTVFCCTVIAGGLIIAGVVFIFLPNFFGDITDFYTEPHLLGTQTDSITFDNESTIKELELEFSVAAGVVTISHSSIQSSELFNVTLKVYTFRKSVEYDPEDVAPLVIQLRITNQRYPSIP